MKKSLKFFKKFDNLLLLLTIYLILFILVHLLVPLEYVNAISDNFNKVAIGFAAIITAYFGSAYFREELTRKRSIEHYRKKYPPDKYKITYKIIVSEDNIDEVYLLDLETLHKHHIWNMKTMYDLGWQVYEREKLKRDEFIPYMTGPPIRTRGDLGE